MNLAAHLLLATAIAMPAHAQLLASFVDRNRILLVFAPGQADQRFQQQIQLLAHHSRQLADRDLLVIPVLVEAGSSPSAATLRTLNPPLVSESEQLTIRNRFHVAPDQFAAILLGKDGGEKLRSLTPIPVERLDRTIDAMPMRRQEMKDRNPG